MKRSMTGFDRSVASKPFDQTNNDLKNSQFMRMSASGSGFTIRAGGLSSGRSGTFNMNSTSTGFNREYNLPLRIVKEWVHQNCDSSKGSFGDFCRLSGSDKNALISDDIW